MSKGKDKRSSRHFDTINVTAVPRGRKGKHHDLVHRIVSDLEALQPGSALKIPFAEFNGIKLANIRAALNRITKARKIDVNTSTDDSSLYVWRSAG